MLAEKIKVQILNRIEGKNLSISSLEKKAQLSPNTIRNIIYGTSKNPGIKLLAAIAEVLECSIDELLGETTINEKKITTPAIEYTTLVVELFDEVVNVVENYIKINKVTIPFETFLFFIKESYIFSLIKNNKKVSTNFIEWLIENNINK